MTNHFWKKYGRQEQRAVICKKCEVIKYNVGVTQSGSGAYRLPYKIGLVKKLPECKVKKE